MSDYPTVTVVIPYSEQFTPAWMLAEAEASAAAQSVPTDVLVVEGTDGPSKVRNRGLKRADTRYVAFLDADDQWTENKLARQLDAMQAADAGLCLEGEPRTLDDFVFDIIVGNLTALMSSVLVDTDRVSARFDEELVRSEDLLYILEAATQAGVTLVPDLFVRREHEDSMMASGISAADYLAQGKRFGYLVSERVPDAQPFLTTYYTQVYTDVGRAYHDAGEYERARTYFLRALRITPHPYTALALLRTLLASVVP